MNMKGIANTKQIKEIIALRSGIRCIAREGIFFKASNVGTKLIE
jgi:hypothetical protein